MDEDTLLEILARKSEAELKEIIAEAEGIVLHGHASSISALGSSTTLDRKSAMEVLRLAYRALTQREAGEDATDPISLRPVQGHAVRFASMALSGP